MPFRTLLAPLTSLVWLLAAELVFSQAHGDEDRDLFTLQRTEVNAKIPKALSDHTASVSTSNNLIYLAGGCDHENGNVFDEEIEQFVCDSISSSFYSFDPATEEYVTLPDMPRERFRHAAVAINNQVWIFGGRNVTDGLVEEVVDVYDISAETWKNYSIPEEYVTSDLGAFATATHAVFVGGYNADYAAQSTVFAIDVVASTEGDSLVIEDYANLAQSRGDIAAAVDLESGYAYVGGGFTHEDDGENVFGFCSPLETVERYDIRSNEWETIAPLLTARADKVMIILHEHVLTMGGERQPEDICSIEEPEVGELTVPVDDVEVLNHDGNEWDVLPSLPEHRFRFAAAVYNDVLYTFGGQQAYESNCMCHKTTDEVVMYTAVFDSQPPEVSQPPDTEPPSTSASSCLGLATWKLLLVLPIIWAL